MNSSPLRTQATDTEDMLSHSHPVLYGVIAGTVLLAGIATIGVLRGHDTPHKPAATITPLPVATASATPVPTVTPSTPVPLPAEPKTQTCWWASDPNTSLTKQTCISY